MALGLLLIAYGTFLTLTRWHRFGRYLIVAVLLAGAAIGYLPVADWVASPLEDRFSIPDPVPDHVDGILVLGGGEDRRISGSRGVASMHEGVLHLLTASALLRAHPEAQLYFSGGGASQTVTHPTESEIARVLLVEMDTDMSRVHFEDRSRNTWENFLYTKKLAQPEPDQTWLLVTSALHMPRSMGIARKLDWPVLAYPTDYRTVPAGRNHWPASMTGSLDTFSAALREWIGLAGYRLTGKIDTLFPGPTDPTDP
jgi:uncharacterized SAM-binding protein YcdF (DUF218 family)